MHDSKIIDVGGVFVGIAVSHASTPGCTFVATHADVRALDGQSAVDAADLWRQASSLMRRAASNRVAGRALC